MHQKKTTILITILIIGIYFGTNTIPSKTIISQPLITTLYVGGSGPNNFTTIQSAINEATPHDFIFIYNDSSPYHEHLTISIPLTLQGEHEPTTIIDGDNTSDVISVYAENVTITNLMVQHSGPTSIEDAAIELYTNNNYLHNITIANTPGFSVGIFLNNTKHNQIIDTTIHTIGNEGIYIKYGSYNLIKNNNIYNCGHVGIVTDATTNNLITHNHIHHNFAGISLWPKSTHNTISHNLLEYNNFSGIGIWPTATYHHISHNQINHNYQWGIHILKADNNYIEHNHITNNAIGIYLNNSKYARIHANIFQFNLQHAGFINATKNLYWCNYWDDCTTILFYKIHGTRAFPWDPQRQTEWVHLDLLPKKTPGANTKK